MKVSTFPKIHKLIDEIKGFERDGSAVHFFEQFKVLRAKFEFQLDVKKCKVVAVTSAIAAEGKTRVCANLATNLALTGRKKVLVIDADMRKSDLARYWKVTSRPGLSDFLRGSVPLEKVVLQPAKQLHFIPGGERVSETTSLLSGEKFRSFLQEMRGRFDVILLDTPPVIPVADTMNIRDQVDSFVLIFRIGFTPYVMLRQVVEDIEKDKIMGVVLNCVDPQRQKYYKRYYGKYYHKKSE